MISSGVPLETMLTMYSFSLLCLLLLSGVNETNSVLIVHPTTGNVTGTFAYSINNKEDVNKHQWSILNPTSTGVLFVFETFNMYSAEVQITEKYVNGADAILFKCASCGDLMPNYFQSTSPSVTISAFGVVDGNSLTPSSFNLRFVNILIASDPALLSLNFDFNMGYAHIKPLLLSNGKLPAGAIQTWAIDTTEGASTNNIKFTLSDLIFADTTGLTTLNIYDSPDPNTRNTLYTRQSDGSADIVDFWLYSTTGLAYVVLNNSLLGQDSFTSFQLTYLGEKDLYNCGSMTGQLDTLTAVTGFLSDGSRPSFDSSGSIRRSMDCTWLIKPTHGYENDTITLIFNWVSLKQGSQVLVYDFHNSSGSILWNSGQQFFQGGMQGKSITTPPPIISTSKELYVRFLSESGEDETYFGFYGEYYLNHALSHGVGSRTQIMSMSSAIDVALPGQSGNYATNFQYKYRIVPQYVSAGSKITFVVNDIDLPNAEDTLTVYDGSAVDVNKVIVVLSGKTVAPLTWFTSVTSQALIVFDSQADSTHGGRINLNYFTDGPNYHCGFTRNPARLTAPAMTIFDGSSYDAAATSADAFQGQNCIWEIEPKDSTGIFLYFTEFSVVSGSLCFFDGSYTRIGCIKNTVAVPAPLFLPYNKVSLQYWTNNMATGVFKGKGFRAHYYRQSSDTSVLSTPGDGIIRLYSSSMTELSNYENLNYIRPGLNLTYAIAPKQYVDNYIYFSIAMINLGGSTCNSKLRLYDGPNTAYPLLGEYCGNSIEEYGSKWIVTSSAEATLTFTSNNDVVDNFGDFKIAYFSNGPNSHCGFNVNPGKLSSQSMVFTDGSSSNEKMYNHQHCEWIIQPDPTEASNSGTGTGGFVALEFLYSDLRGALIEVYKGTSLNNDKLLWKCYGCQIIPKLMVSDEGSLFVRFISWGASRTSSDMGQGFKAVYWSANKTSEESLTKFKKAEGKVLEIPPGIKIMGGSNENDTLAWHLGLGDSDETQMMLGVTNVLTFKPRVVSSISHTTGVMENLIRDGRTTSRTEDYQTATSTKSGSCGTVVGNHTNVLIGDTFSLRSTQWAQSYMTSSSAGVVVHDSYGSLDTSSSNSFDSQYLPASVCKYILDSGSRQSINIRGSFTASGSRLRIWGGKYGNDGVVLFDSYRDDITGGPTLFDVVAPCGASVILLELNETIASTLNHFLTLEYERNSEILEGQTCADYYFSLLPKVIIPNPWIPYYIAMGGCFGLCCLFFSYMYLRKMYHKYYPENGCNPFKEIKIYRIVTPRHLGYTPKWDAFRNRFLGNGECMICQEHTAIFKLSPCSHKICPEDLSGYLGAALSDISLFPVKCPLHYEGCTSTIDAKIAKRVLGQLEFAKFNEFSDRSKYGEGMRCIFCNNYVNFPEEGKFSMVECPYCIQTFCIRCKKPWHFGSKCPLDGIDDSLMDWQKSSGAAKCPACSKLIEKSDVETCNHMIHKITDGIPCIKDRTDFCYCCGEEIEGEYPHDEVKRPGVNHFPEGVYQKCRYILQQERDSERDRLKRLRRMKNSAGSHVKREVSFNGLELGNDGQVATDSEGWEKIPDYLLNEGREARGADARLGDAFDQQWDTEMATAQGAARSEIDLSDDSEEEVDLGQTVPGSSQKITLPHVVISPSAQRQNRNGNNSPAQARSGSSTPTGLATPLSSPFSSRQGPPQRNITPTQVPKRQAARVSPGHSY